MESNTLSGKRILITGAARGMGLGMARAFAARGAELILWDLDEAGVEAAAAGLPASARARAYACDISDRAAVARTAADVLADGGTVDILVNNAGIVSGKPIMELTDEAIERTFAVNTLAHFWTVRAFLPAMIERGDGHVVTIASSGGLTGTARLTDYCASKFAAVGFDESLRLEAQRLGYPIRTTVVCPFFVNTGMFEGVRSRVSWLLPVLEPDAVVRRVVRAVERGKARVLMPWFVYTVFPVRLLPVPWFDAIVRWLGVTRAMDQFTGRKSV